MLVTCHLLNAKLIGLSVRNLSRRTNCTNLLFRGSEPGHGGTLALRVLGGCIGTKAICHDVPAVGQVEEVNLVPRTSGRLDGCCSIQV